MDPLVRFLKHPAVQGIPVYLETPLDDAGHQEEIRMLRQKVQE